MSRIPFTDEMHQTLLALKEKTGVGARALVSRWDNKPKGVTDPLISTWIHRRTKMVDGKQYKTVIAYWASIGEAVPITPKMHKALLAEKKRVGIGGEILFKYAAEDIPARLKVSMIKRWMSGQTRMANKAHYDFVMASYAKLTAEKIYRLRHLEKDNHIEFTKEIKSKLKRLQRESGISAMRLLKGRKDIPDGLNSAIISNWLNGSIKSARKEHFDYALKIWNETTPRLNVTDKMLSQLKREEQRTGQKPSRLLSLFSSAPKGLRTAALHRIIDGDTKTIDQGHWDFLFAAYKALPDVQTTKKKYYIGRPENAHSKPNNKKTK